MNVARGDPDIRYIINEGIDAIQNLVMYTNYSPNPPIKECNTFSLLMSFIDITPD